MNKKTNQPKNKSRFTFKESVTIPIFMSLIPKLIALWQEKKPNVAFDIFLLECVEEYNKNFKK